MTTTTADLQITRFHNCSQCIGKVKREVRGFDGVELLGSVSENGKFTIKTTRNPEEIRVALQRKFAKSVLLSNIINHSNPSPALINPHNSFIQGPPNSHDTEAVVAVARAIGAQSVEVRQSSAIIFYINNQPTTSGTATYAPPLPSAPPPPPPPQQQQQEDQPTTIGSAWPDENIDGYVGGRNGNFGYGSVNPPPQQPTTSGSAWITENFAGFGYGGARNDDFGYGSAPLIPTAQTQGYVYGHPYPIELYRDDDYLRGGCCTIL